MRRMSRRMSKRQRWIRTRCRRSSRRKETDYSKEHRPGEERGAESRGRMEEGWRSTGGVVWRNLVDVVDHFGNEADSGPIDIDQPS